MSPRTQLIVGKVFEEARLPAGVLNFVSFSKEDAPSLTAEIVANPAFVGSDRVGRIVAMEAAKHLKPCVLELDGLKDTSCCIGRCGHPRSREAAKAIVQGAMCNLARPAYRPKGSLCKAASRTALSAPSRDFAHLGKLEMLSMILPFRYALFYIDNILEMIRDAEADGAEINLGDLMKDGRQTPRNIQYSLAASLWTSDIAFVQQIAERMRSGAREKGYVNINGTKLHVEPIDGLQGLGGSSDMIASMSKTSISVL
ncbi:unnamed protein product [Cyclocybe aegerita]|uniref:Aldehyde dehydrogenase domain-containing protein n=1 Tax=Cyclocybe aegerita TaxID=1973307 RepID=A0A8S0VZC7_CYCAE|nr:unnamed protein product [Cyclocybe aegerita]